MDFLEYCRAEIPKLIEESEKAFNVLILKKLEPYGITKDNIKDYIDSGKLFIMSVDPNEIEDFNFYLHNKLIFSLHKHVELVKSDGVWCIDTYYTFSDTKKDDVDG